MSTTEFFQPLNSTYYNLDSLRFVHSALQTSDVEPAAELSKRQNSKVRANDVIILVSLYVGPRKGLSQAL